MLTADDDDEDDDMYDVARPYAEQGRARELS